MNSTGSFPLGTPPAEYALEAELVAGLIADQHPDLARLPLQIVDAGWDNALFRLGNDLAVRLPRRAASAALVVNEQTWLPRLAPRLPLPIPVPLRMGTPGRGYPWRWSIVPWLAGSAADQHEPASSQAAPLAAFLRALHVAAPGDAPVNPFRGCSLDVRVPSAVERMERLALKTNLITPAIGRIWDQAVGAALDVAPTWLHGDLHPGNVLVAGGAISGVIDWGDITSGDCATDLAAIWMLFDEPRARYDALAAYNCSEATLQRARGWVLLFGLLLLDTGLIDHPRHAIIGERTLRRVAQSP